MAGVERLRFDQTR